VPIRLGEHYQRKRRAHEQRALIKLLSFAAAAGVAVGLGSIAFTEGSHSQLGKAMNAVSVKTA
jgi:hypothetical protein